MIYNKYIALTFLFLSMLLSSCDFEEKNINPNNSSTIQPEALLTYSQFYTSNEGLSKRVQVGYCMMMVQQTASLERDEMAGDKYLETEMLGVFFTESYTSGIKNIQELINQTESKDDWINTYAVALIWKSFLFHRITDLYGDIPYSEAGNGYMTQNFYPKYDSQKSVYEGMIADIEHGLSLLDQNNPTPIKGDIIYQGNIEKWKRFANSLLLRLGMRLEHVEPKLARTTVEKAIQRGVMQETSDICLVQHYSNKSAVENPLSSVFKSHGLVNSGAVKISTRFMNYLKQTTDPRMKVYFSLPDGNNNPEDQKALPNGYDILSIYAGDPTFTTLAAYSNFNTATILQLDAPTIHMTYAETELLKAEAVIKGWISGDAEESYKKAVRSSMHQQAYYGNQGVIDEQEIDQYLEQNLFSKATTTEAKLNVLGTEFWVATFLNGYESYANWRRTGYPLLTPVSYTASPNSGKIPRRFSYPTVEYSINPMNVKEAAERQGGDEVSTPIWWDKN